MCHERIRFPNMEIHKVQKLCCSTRLQHTSQQSLCVCQLCRESLGMKNRWFALRRVYQYNVMPDFFSVPQPGSLGVSLTLIIGCVYLLNFLCEFNISCHSWKAVACYRLQLMGCGRYGAARRQRKWGKTSSWICYKLNMSKCM